MQNVGSSSSTAALEDVKIWTILFYINLNSSLLNYAVEAQWSVAHVLTESTCCGVLENILAFGRSVCSQRLCILFHKAAFCFQKYKDTVRLRSSHQTGFLPCFDIGQ